MSTQLGLLGSLCLHLCLTLWVTTRPTTQNQATAEERWPTYAVELTVSARGEAPTKTNEPQPDQFMLTGSLAANAADTWQRGGDTGGAPEVVNLGSRIGETRIRDVPRNNSALDQLQRIHTSRERRSEQRARQTPNPATAAVLSTGQGSSDARHRSRRKSLSRDNEKHQRDKTEVGVGEKRPPSPDGAATATTNAHLASSRTLRPDLTRGYAATDTAWHARRPADNVDSTSASRASADGNIEQTASRLGTDGVGTGDARQLPGARSLASSPLGGPVRGPVGNAAYDQWLAKQRKAISDELRFPKARKISFDQGVSVFELLVSRDGRVLRGPALVRSSGFHDFDSEGRRAINATQFAPLPDSLTLGDRSLKVTMVVRFFNPMTF